MDEKLKSENMQKEQFSEWGMGWDDKIFFASGGKEALPRNQNHADARAVSCRRPLVDRCLTRDGVSLYCLHDFYTGRM